MSTIQLRRGTAAEWIAANPILAAGEPGVEIDTGKIKAGDGVNPWVVLSYVGGISASDLTAERIATTPLKNKSMSGLENSFSNLPAAAIGTGLLSAARLGAGSTGSGARALFDDQTYKAITGGGDALQASPLSQFASTTSAQLRGVLSDKTGSGVAVFGTAPNITAPTGIVKADVGLGSVDNVADASKPISTLQQAALDTKSTLGLFPQVLITSSRSLMATDIGKEVHNASGTARTLTIDTTATSGIAWVPGKFFGAGRSGSGTLTISAALGTTIVNPDSLTVVQDAGLPLAVRMTQTTDRWIIG